MSLTTVWVLKYFKNTLNTLTPVIWIYNWDFNFTWLLECQLQIKESEPFLFLDIEWRKSWRQAEKVFQETDQKYSGPHSKYKYNCLY